MDLVTAIEFKNVQRVKELFAENCDVTIYALNKAVCGGNLRIIKIFENAGWDVFAYVPISVYTNPDTLNYYITHEPGKTFGKIYPVGNLRLAVLMEFILAFPKDTTKIQTKQTLRLLEIREKIATRKLKYHLNCGYINRKFLREQQTDLLLLIKNDYFK
jgi:hypothetical protein